MCSICEWSEWAWTMMLADWCFETFLSSNCLKTITLQTAFPSLSEIPPPPPIPHVLVDFVVLPPGHGSNVTDFWGRDAHEAQLRCPDDVSGVIGGCSARRALKPKFYQPTQTMVTAAILPFRENSHSRAGNRTRDIMISSQRLWPLDHEAGLRWDITV